MREHHNPLENAFTPFASVWGAAGLQDRLDAFATQALDPQRWFGIGWTSLEQPLEMLLGLPRFALPMLDRKLLALAGGWLLLLERAGEYGLLVSRAWSAAYAELVTELNRAAAEGKPVHAGRELLDRWIAVLNRKMQGVQRSEAFLASQHRLLETFLSNRTREREIVELIATAFDLPTRTEMDDAHRSVRDLKREVRALRREIETLRASVPNASLLRIPARSAAGGTRDGAGAKGGGNGSPHPIRPGEVDPGVGRGAA